MSSTWLVGAPAALVAAAFFGAAGVLQHQAARSVPERVPLRVGLLVQLVRIPGFRYGVICAALGFGLQILALHAAPLPVVQPILVTGVLFYLLWGTLFLDRPVDPKLVLGALLALAGLSGFLVVASPTAGTSNISGVAVLPLSIALAGVVVICLAVAARTHSENRSIPFAIATAVFYGVTAGLVRSLVTQPYDGVGGLFTHWQLYAIAVVGPLGFLLNQNAFQEGVVGSVAVGIITVGDPMVSIGLGVAWFGDRLTEGPAAVTGQVLLLILMTGGIVILTHRANLMALAIRESSDRETT
ncbi:MAG: DMT family transporter [Intrasporangium sp.]|uniref:DMT family transporter n=1 Tax=Intrasporangium sp. TaxID=1925024 RepID=UPI002648FBF6|nr:DMT family transporter [Intrasporangium sp.]MDN5797377.1 DMT family transporter [Intrasporangium sp.]